MTEPLHVTLVGDLDGRYVVKEQHSDGSLLLAPERPYPALVGTPPGRSATPEEFDAHFGDLRPDDEP